jgi:hypothetical protein
LLVSRFLIDAGRPVCPRLLRVQPLPVSDRLPRDIPVDQLLLFLAEIEGRMGQCEADSTPDPGLMLAPVDSLHAGTLNEAQREAVP